MGEDGNPLHELPGSSYIQIHILAVYIDAYSG